MIFLSIRLNHYFGKRWHYLMVQSVSSIIDENCEIYTRRIWCVYEVLVFLREAKLDYQFEANTQHHHIQHLHNGKQETGNRARVIEKWFDQPKLLCVVFISNVFCLRDMEDARWLHYDYNDVSEADHGITGSQGRKISLWRSSVAHDRQRWFDKDRC